MRKARIVLLTAVLMPFPLASVSAQTQDGGSSNAVVSEAEVADCKQQPYSILITVGNVKKDKGLITADLHGDNPDTFLKSGAKLARIRVPVEPGETEVCVPVDGPGRYAVALYHDRNANMKFDKTWIGLPDEPYAVTNDPPIRFGPPDLEDSLVVVSGPLTPAKATLSK